MNFSMDINKKGTRNIASNTVMLDGRNLGRYVVMLDGDVVDSFFPLTCELPFTEWLSEPILLYTDFAGVIRMQR